MKTASQQKADGGSPFAPVRATAAKPHLGGKAARSGHDPILSRTGASGNPGAVQHGEEWWLWEG